MKFNIITFGCKVNQYESNMMKEKMLHHNFSYVQNLDETDIIIVNTCTVTNTADNKCLKEIRRIKRNYPDRVLVVTGCSSQNKQELYQTLGINILLGNKDKSKIALLIEEYLSNKENIVNFNNNRDIEFENMQIKDFNHVRAFIKIEDGCDNFCSYCIIPFVRGKVRSKDFYEILEEAKTLALNGHQEIVLTGIHTGHYENNGHDLSDLIKALALIPEIKRIRLSSIEITELNEKFMETLKTTPKLCDHLHIPLQSGTDKILQKMNRKYDLAYFTKQIALLRKIRPNIALSTDIIVGHPYETDEDFAQSLAYAKECQFAKIHVFPYSKRENTVASKMPEQVKEEVKKERVKKLMALSKELEEEYYHKFKGQMMDVLIETNENSYSIGHTSNYLLVKIDELLDIGSIYERRI